MNRLLILSLPLLAVLTAALPTRAATTQRIASGLSRPVFVTAPAGDEDRIFIIEQWAARIRIYRHSTGTLNTTPFLDINPLVVDTGNERGLLGLAFHPAYDQNGYFFVYYVDNQNFSVVARYQASGTNPDSALLNSGQIVIRIPQPAFENHKAGMLAFGPLDGYLYVALGDGGSGGDPGNRAQSDTTLLGKILRLDVDPLPYAIPPDNPFASPVDGIRDEIWSKGFRNPWRFSFDRLTGAMYIADVGQGLYEEVNYEPPLTAGRNYGWRLMEGAHCYNPPVNCDPGGLIYPIHEYTHDQGCSISGGYVYRGCAIPEYDGLYFFADFCSDSIWSFRYNGSVLTELTNRTAELAPGGGLTLGNISSFGEDSRGELYLCDLSDGEVFRIEPDTIVDENHNGIPDGCECPELAASSVVIQPADSDVVLSWTAAPGAAYRIYRATTAAAPFPGSGWELVTTLAPGAAQYTDSGVLSGSDSYFYLVTAVCP